jgi:hypothetical protein
MSDYILGIGFGTNEFKVLEFWQDNEIKYILRIIDLHLQLFLSSFGKQ